MDPARHAVMLEVLEIEPVDDIERTHRDDTIAWLRSGAEIFRRQKPATPPMHLVAYCAPVDVGANAMLLVDHLDAGHWLPPGGHVEPGEHPRDTVVRESREELQLELTSAAVDAPRFVTVEHTVGASAGHVDVSFWYLVRASVEDRFAADLSEFRSLEWWPFDRIVGAGREVGPHVERFVMKLTEAPR